MKHLNKFLTMLLAVILTLSPVLTLTAGAVEFPEGVTREQTLETVDKLNALLKNILASNEETKDLKGTVYSMLYKDETVNSIFTGIYGALGENADALSVIGVEITPAALSSALSEYKSVSKKIAACADLGAVLNAAKDFKWDIDSKNEFSNALASMLSPFNSLLNALLCSGEVKINSLISIKGDDGYSAAIIPLLKALDCPEIMSSADFSESAAKNHKNIIKNIISMVFKALDRILDDPVKGICRTLPKIAFYLDSGKLSSSITSLLEPLSLKIAGIFTIPGISDLITSAANLEESMNFDELLEGIDLSSLLGSDVKLQLPDIDFKELSSTVTETGGELVTDEAASFIVIMNYLIEVLKLNKDQLGALMGAGDMSSVLDPLLAKTNDEIIKTIITLFTLKSVPANNFTWTFPQVTSTAVSLTPTYTEADYLGFLDKIDPLLTDFVKESDPEGTIESTLRKIIYSNSLVSTLVVEVFKMMGSEEMAPLFSLLGMDVTPTGIGNAIYQYYPYTARQLYRYSSWDRVNPASLSWGFYNGDSAGFKKAVTRVLSPFTPLLTCMLAGQNVTLLDAVTIPGADGYNTAIIPLLEALGCKSENIKSYNEYVKGVGSSDIIGDILDPIIKLLDEVCASPVKTLCRILPNIVYFFNSGHMTSVIENLIYPVKYMLDTAGMGDMLSSSFADMGELDLSKMMGELLSGTDLGITLPELDVKTLGTIGTLESFPSKRTQGGAPATYSYLTSDNAGVFLTLLRYFVGALSMEENSGLLTGLMGSGESAPSENGMPDMFAMYAGNIAEKFKGMTTDEIIEWLCDLLFSESPIKELPPEDEEIPTIIYEEKFTLSTTAKILIVIGVIIAAVLLYVILSVTGKLDNVKLRRKKKQEIKRRKKESKKLIKGGGVAVEAMTETPKRKKSETVSSKNPEAAAIKAEDTVTAKASASSPYLDALSSDSHREALISARKEQALKEMKLSDEKAKARSERKAAADEKKDSRIANTRLPDEKEAEKLMRRQTAAARKAQKNELKIQKHYEKAKKQMLKKQKKSSREGNK